MSTEYEKKLEEALVDILDGTEPRDLQRLTGLKIERCDEIVQFYQRAVINNRRSRPKPTVTIVFTRLEGPSTIGEAAVMLVTVMPDRFQLHGGYPSPDDVMVKLKEAMTEWAERTEDGQVAWRRSSQDFNVGDFCSDDCDVSKSLQGFLNSKGILHIHAETMTSAGIREFDEHLMDPEVKS